MCEGKAFSYYVVYPESDASRPNVRAFSDWMLKEAKEIELY